MGWYPVDSIKITRDYDRHEIVFTWKDAVLGDQEKRFPSGTTKEEIAKAFIEIFFELAM